jgi:hypothetical protein
LPPYSRPITKAQAPLTSIETMVIVVRPNLSANPFLASPIHFAHARKHAAKPTNADHAEGCQTCPFRAHARDFEAGEEENRHPFLASQARQFIPHGVKLPHVTQVSQVGKHKGGYERNANYFAFRPEYLRHIFPVETGQ